MSQELGVPDRHAASIVPVDVPDAALAEVLAHTAQAASLADAGRRLVSGLSQVLQIPVALLSRDEMGWRFEAGAVPGADGASDDPSLAELASCAATATAVNPLTRPWTGVVVGNAKTREWVLMVPGSGDDWHGMEWMDRFIDNARSSIGDVSSRSDERLLVGFGRRLHGFTRRLARAEGGTRVYDLILRTMAREVRAQTGAIAVFSESEQALNLTATFGYPQAIVEHVQIRPGEGIIGRAFASRHASLGIAPSDQRRLRYATDSYVVVPIVGDQQAFGVVALTDRADRRPFEREDLDALRVLAGPAALAIAREHLQGSIGDLRRAVTVDPLSGLFNRRYFEDRLRAETERSRRQGQSLALLMVDVDDFKRINDTFGHIEGDRALQDVAELLRRGVRIFDVCARFGGEEFAIVMPGAGADMAVQVAERIRRRVEEQSRHGARPITVSIGVGMLQQDEGMEDLVERADRALITAKRSGKNRVQLGLDS
jgi:diguanylate cyclase (GGDEF)-like protein